MSVIKLLGCNASRVPGLQRPGVSRWEEGSLSELAHRRPDDELWLVSSRLAAEFKEAVGGTPPPNALLLIPAGEEEQPVGDWWRHFRMQLSEEDQDDAELLERLSRCPRIFEWSEALDRIAREWFLALEQSPRLVPTSRLPFSKDEIRHLETCAACSAAVYEHLEQEATNHWAMSCPSAPAIAKWLSTGPDPWLEAHLQVCRSCRETGVNAAWMLEDAGLTETVIAAEKASAIGLPQRRAAWYETKLVWPLESVINTAERLAAFLTLSLSSGPVLRTAERGEPGGGGPLTLADLASELASGLSRQAVPTQDRWFRIALRNGAIFLWAGGSAANRFQDFRIDFCRDGKSLISVTAQSGVALITEDVIGTIAASGADEIAVTPEGGSTHGHP